MKVDIFVRPSFYSTFYVNSHIDKASSFRANKLSFLFLPSAIVSFGGSKPSFGGNKPSFGGSKPSFGGNKPSFGGSKPSFGGSKPSFGEGKQ